MKLLQYILRLLARAILWRHKPRCIAIVGSVGKTSAKEAIYRVASHRMRARKAEGSYNNELGVPLTIIGSEAQGKNLFGWIFVGFKALVQILFNPAYPQVLVLEFGESNPGDIAYLMKLVRPEIVVVTSIAPVHIEFFKSIDGVAKELGSAVKLLRSEGAAILNIDDPLVSKLAGTAHKRVISVGTGKDADIRANQLGIVSRGDQVGLQAKVEYQGNSVPIFLPGVPARHQAYAIVEAAAVGIRLGMNLVDIGEAISKYRPPRGRTNLIHGIRDSLVIDDTYNASPTAAKAALRIFEDMPLHDDAKRIAVLGDMLELGDYTERGHREVGALAAQAGITVLVTVGPLAREIANGAIEEGMDPNKVVQYSNHVEAIAFLKDRISSHDVILVKGSQGARMERVVKAIMAEPEKASELLVRQSSKWLKTP